jgi:hypothetical protein
MVLARTGDQPVTPAWLWEQVAEYRIPLPKLLLLALANLTGNDFRADMAFGVLALSALAFAMIRVAKSLRGWTTYSDAFFPLALLHLGHHASFLWSFWGIALLWALLLGVLLLTVVRGGAQLTLRTAILAGTCLVLLPLCGDPISVPALALWLGYAGVRTWRSQPHGRRDGLVMLAFAAAALLVVGLYFLGFQAPYDFYAPASAVPVKFEPANSLRASLQFLALGLGPAAAAFWPLSGWGVAGLLLLGVAALARAARRGPLPERLRALGLLGFLAGFAGIVLAVGLRRPNAGFITYYTVSAAMGLCCVYFVWLTYSPPDIGGLAQACLFTLACLMFSLNTFEGLHYGRARRRTLAAFEQDLRAGAPTSLLVKRYAPALCPSPVAGTHAYHNHLTERFGALRRARVGPFRHLREDPAFVEVPVPLERAAANQVAWQGGTGRGAGKDSYLVFALPEPRLVGGLRITYAHSNEEGMRPLFRVIWGRGEGGGADRVARGGTIDRWYLGFLYPLPWVLLTGAADKELAIRNEYVDAEHGTGPEEQTVTIWIWDTIDRVRIHPDNRPCTFRISEIVLLTPAADVRLGAGELRPSQVERPLTEGISPFTLPTRQVSASPGKADQPSDGNAAQSERTGLRDGGGNIAHVINAEETWPWPTARSPKAGL